MEGINDNLQASFVRDSAAELQFSNNNSDTGLFEQCFKLLQKKTRIGVAATMMAFGGLLLPSIAQAEKDKKPIPAAIEPKRTMPRHTATLQSYGLGIKPHNHNRQSDKGCGIYFNPIMSTVDSRLQRLNFTGTITLNTQGGKSVIFTSHGLSSALQMPKGCLTDNEFAEIVRRASQLTERDIEKIQLKEKVNQFKQAYGQAAHFDQLPASLKSYGLSAKIPSNILALEPKIDDFKTILSQFPPELVRALGVNQVYFLSSLQDRSKQAIPMTIAGNMLLTNVDQTLEANTFNGLIFALLDKQFGDSDNVLWNKAVTKKDTMTAEEQRKKLAIALLDPKQLVQLLAQAKNDLEMVAQIEIITGCKLDPNNTKTPFTDFTDSEYQAKYGYKLGYFRFWGRGQMGANYWNNNFAELKPAFKSSAHLVR